MLERLLLPMLAVNVLFLMCGAPRALAVDCRFIRIGDMEIVALADVDQDARGGNRPELLVGLGPEDAARYLVPGAMKNSINAFLLKKDGRNVLFDTGLGANGQVWASLEAAGISPDEIDVVCITHFHFDHVGGLMRDGKPAFVKARLYVPRLEKELNGKGAEGFLAAYADRLEVFEHGDEVLPGVGAVDASGHTPGHTGFLLTSGHDRLFIIADLIHFPGIQLPLPDVAVTYDSDPTAAVAARRRLFDRAVRESLPVAAMHMPFPGVGMLRQDGDGYAFFEFGAKN